MRFCTVNGFTNEGEATSLAQAQGLWEPCGLAARRASARATCW